ncbi:IS110 family transposase [Floricoccus tropicus]|uniref:IS110 family transposase n=1 Tax=Floricoccus tropicus TaxID=1859473 RepID=UPI0009498F1E|nr:transposase [Floricoccus tropicus]
MKNLPGRKTEVKDAEWIAQLGRCGLIAPSYIPDSEVMQFHLLTRRLHSYKQRQTQVKNEIHNLLQRVNIKLTSCLSDIFSKTGQKLLNLFINGEIINIDNITTCMHGRIKATSKEILEAMNGKLSYEDRFLIEHSLSEYNMYQKLIGELNQK